MAVIVKKNFVKDNFKTTVSNYGFKKNLKIKKI